MPRQGPPLPCPLQGPAPQWQERPLVEGQADSGHRSLAPARHLLPGALLGTDCPAGQHLNANEGIGMQCRRLVLKPSQKQTPGFLWLDSCQDQASRSSWRAHPQGRPFSTRPAGRQRGLLGEGLLGLGICERGQPGLCRRKHQNHVPSVLAGRCREGPLPGLGPMWVGCQSALRMAAEEPSVREYEGRSSRGLRID